MTEQPTSDRHRPTIAVVAVLLLAALLTACGGDDEPDEAATTTEATTTTAPTTTTTERDADDEVVALTDDGRVVVLDAATGEERRTLLEGVPVDDPFDNDLDRAPGGDDVYVVRPGPTGESSEIVRVPVDGGEPEVVTEGRSVAVSPDGTQLAYTVLEGSLPPEPVVVLRHLESGEERELRREDEPDFYNIPDLVWTPDGSQLAFTAGEIYLGAYVLDADAVTLDAAERLGPVARGDNVTWSALAALDDARLAVAEACCGPPHEDRWLVLAVNLAEQSVEGGLLPAERIEAFRLDGDGDGRLLLVVRGENPPGGATLLRWDGTGEAEPIAEGIVTATW